MWSVLLPLLYCAAASASDLTVRIDGGEAGAVVVLSAENGASQRAVDEDGDGIVVISAPAGEYEVAIELGDHRASHRVSLPRTGTMDLVYHPGADGGTFVMAQQAFADDIVVTARKREENLQEVPLSVTAFTDSDIEQRSMRDLSSVARYTPNLDFGTGGFASEITQATVYIRGVGQIDPAIYSDPAVAIYVDGVYLARSQGAILDLLDVERVEVLRGPQGTLFGKNTTGGALSVITRRPSQRFGLLADLSIGNREHLGARMSLDTALGAKAFQSLSVTHTQRDGFSRSLANGHRYHDDDRDAARWALHAAPSESWTLDLSASFSRKREAGGNNFVLAWVETPLIQFYNGVRRDAGLPEYTDEFVTDDLRVSFATEPPFLDSDLWDTTLRLGWTAPSFTVQSITAYRSVQDHSFSEPDGSPIPLAAREVDLQHEQWSQEIQLVGSSLDQRLDWVIGSLYFEEKPFEVSRILLFGELFEALEAAPGPIYAPPGLPNALCDPGPPPPGVPCFGGAGNPFNLGFFVGDGNLEFRDLETTSWALFGEGSMALNERLSLTVGLRYSYDDKRFDYRTEPGSGAPGADLTNRDTWDAWTPRLSLAYRARDELMLYFSASNGFKSGGFNGQPQEREALDPFDPERVWTYELGFKSTQPRLTLNGAAFYSDYTDIQFGAFLNIDGQPVFITANAGDAEVSGFELEAVAQPFLGTTLSAGVGYLDNHFTRIDPGVPGGLEDGGVLPRAPEWSGHLALQHAWETSSPLGTIIAGADYSYRGKVFNDVQNTPGIAQGAYGLVGARLLVVPSERWELALFGTNQTDESFLGSGFFTGAFGIDVGISGRPREWGVSARFRF